MTTLGKTVTLRKGLVVTDTGPGIVNGTTNEAVRVCVTDDGRELLIMARVIEELPPTYRRAAVRGPLRHPRQLEGPPWRLVGTAGQPAFQNGWANASHASVIHGDPAVCDACRQTACKPVSRDGGVYCGDEAACKARARQKRSHSLLTGREGS